jgi:hypothetical protein
MKDKIIHVSINDVVFTNGFMHVAVKYTIMRLRSPDLGVCVV